MPVQVQKSALLAKLGPQLDAAVKAHAADEVDYGFQRGLPPGIRDGVAKLVECKFEPIPEGKKYAGNWRFVMTGVMVHPRTVIYDGRELPVEGAQTWVFRNVCQTTNSSGKVTPLADNVAEIMNDMKKLGAQFDPAQGATQLEAMAAALKKSCVTPGQEIYFAVTTTPRKDQKTGKETGESWENWGAVIPDYQPGESASVDDQSGAETQDAGQDQPPADDGGVAADDGGIDLDALAVEADGMSLEDALAADGPGTRIKQLAEEVGADVEAVGAANTWAEAAEIVKAAAGASGEANAEPEAEPEPEPWKPKKGDPCGYKAPVKNKAGKMVPGSKIVQCEITAVNAKSGTADLAELANKKNVHKGVKLDQLVQLS